MEIQVLIRSCLHMFLEEEEWHLLSVLNTFRLFSTFLSIFDRFFHHVVQEYIETIPLMEKTYFVHEIQFQTWW